MGRLVHSVQGPHHAVHVFVDDGFQYMCFSKGEKRVQAGVCLQQPDRVVDPYVGCMLAAATAHSHAPAMLVLGVGGGILPMALRRVLPDARIDAVDHDPCVLDAARDFFGLTPDDRLALHVRDAREFVERARADGHRYDVVILDVFDEDYIPAPLMSAEFLQDVRALLAAGGIMVANTFGPPALQRREYATYAHVFGDFCAALVDWNRVLVAGAGPSWPASSPPGAAQPVQDGLTAVGVDAREMLSHLAPVKAHPSLGRPIVDAELGTAGLQALRRQAVARPVEGLAGFPWSAMAFAVLQGSRDARAEAATATAGSGIPT